MYLVIRGECLNTHFESFTVQTRKQDQNKKKYCFRFLYKKCGNKSWNCTRIDA